MRVVEIEVEEMPRYVGHALTEFGAVFSDSAVKKGFNEYGLDWVRIAQTIKAFLDKGMREPSKSRITRDSVRPGI